VECTAAWGREWGNRVEGVGTRDGVRCGCRGWGRRKDILAILYVLLV